MQIKNRKKIYLEEIDREFPKAAQDDQKQAKIQLLNELEKFEENYRGKHIVADLYQLAKVNSAYFNPESRILLHKNCLIECAHFVETNWKFATGGKLYILDEAKTEKHIEGNAAWKAEQKKKAELEATVGTEVINNLSQIGKAAAQKVAAVKNDEAIDAATEGETKGKKK